MAETRPGVSVSKPNLPAIADGIVAAVSMRARPYEPDAGWNPPELLVPMPDIEQVTFTGEGHWRLAYALKLVVSSAWDRAAHINLGELLPTTKLEIQAATTLGTTSEGWHVRSVEPDAELRDRNGDDWFGAVLNLEVWT